MTSNTRGSTGVVAALSRYTVSVEVTSLLILGLYAAPERYGNPPQPRSVRLYQETVTRSSRHSRSSGSQARRRRCPPPRECAARTDPNHRGPSNRPGRPAGWRRPRSTRPTPPPALGSCRVRRRSSPTQWAAPRRPHAFLMSRHVYNIPVMLLDLRQMRRSLGDECRIAGMIPDRQYRRPERSTSFFVLCSTATAAR